MICSRDKNSICFFSPKYIEPVKDDGVCEFKYKHISVSVELMSFWGVRVRKDSMFIAAAKHGWDEEIKFYNAKYNMTCDMLFNSFQTLGIRL